MGSEMCIRDSESTQSISWRNGSTGVKIKAGGRIELNGLFLKINNVQLDDAGTYECRGASATRFYTIYVNGEYCSFSCYSSLRHYFVTPHHEYKAMFFFWYFTVPKFAISQSEANYAVLISYDIKSLT